MLRIETIGNDPMFKLAGLKRLVVLVPGDSAKGAHKVEAHAILDEVEEHMTQFNVTTEMLTEARATVDNFDGLAADATAVALALNAIELPDSFDGKGFDFIPCDCSNPIPHGLLDHPGGRIPVEHLSTAWLQLAEAAEGGVISPEQSIHGFKLLMAADLALDAHALQDRRKAAEERQRTDTLNAHLREQAAMSAPRLEAIKDPLLSLVGFSRVQILIGDQSYGSITGAQAERNLVTLTKALGDEMIAPLREDLTKVTMPADTAVLMAAVREFQLPEGFDGEGFGFEQCLAENCYPLPHGSISHGNGKRLENVINGLLMIMDLMERYGFSPEQGIHALQQMLTIDMALDKDDQEQRYAEAPAEARKTWEARLGGDMSAGMAEALGSMPPELAEALAGFGGPGEGGPIIIGPNGPMRL